MAVAEKFLWGVKPPDQVVARIQALDPQLFVAWVENIKGTPGLNGWGIFRRCSLPHGLEPNHPEVSAEHFIQVMEVLIDAKPLVIDPLDARLEEAFRYRNYCAVNMSYEDLLQKFREQKRERKAREISMDREIMLRDIDKFHYSVKKWAHEHNLGVWMRDALKEGVLQKKERENAMRQAEAA